MSKRRLLSATPAVIVLIAVIALVSYLSGCAETRRHDVAAPPAGAVAEAMALLNSIAVEPEHRGDYKREDWPHWRPGRSRCISVREEVLMRDSQTPAALSADQCAIISGVWLDSYTGQTITDPKQIDVDHVVPLEEASQSGGWKWSREQRTAYANDLSDHRTLIAVSAAANRAKGSKGPEEWLPPDLSRVCAYLANWVIIKARWQLSMDAVEAAAVQARLQNCL